MMIVVIQQLSYKAIMGLHRLFAIHLDKGQTPAHNARIAIKEKILMAELLSRVPVSHLWEVEKLQRDLNLKIND